MSRVYSYVKSRVVAVIVFSGLALGGFFIYIYCGHGDVEVLVRDSGKPKAKNFIDDRASMVVFTDSSVVEYRQAKEIVEKVFDPSRYRKISIHRELATRLEGSVALSEVCLFGGSSLTPWKSQVMPLAFCVVFPVGEPLPSKPEVPVAVVLSPRIEFGAVNRVWYDWCMKHNLPVKTAAGVASGDIQRGLSEVHLELMERFFGPSAVKWK